MDYKKFAKEVKNNFILMYKWVNIVSPEKNLYYVP